jgi:hypothetical protein
MTNSERAKRVKLALRDKVRLMRLLCRVEVSHVDWFSVDAYSGSKSFPFSITVKNHAKQSSRSVVSKSAFDILIILILRCLSKVRESVICFITVDVVYRVFWPFSGHVQPNQSMYEITLMRYLRPDVPANGTSIAYDKGRSRVGPPRPGFPRHNSSFWVVINKFAQTFCSKLRLSHDAPQMLIGERPARDYDSFAGFAIIHGVA